MYNHNIMLKECQKHVKIILTNDKKNLFMMMKNKTKTCQNISFCILWIKIKIRYI